MVTHWKINGLDPELQLYSLGYQYNNKNVVFLFADEDEKHQISIQFPTTVEFISIEYLENTLSSEDRVYNLMLEADCAGPIYPFFIRSTSVLISKVKSVEYAFREDRIFLQYTMVTCDYWIDVVSSKPPTVSIQTCADA